MRASFAAGWAIARAANQADAELVIEAARRGDELACEVVGRAFSGLGVAVANSINLLDPDLIVLGGGMARASDLLLPALQAALAEHVVPHLRDASRLVLSHFGRNAPLVGAAVAAADGLSL